MMLSPLLQLQSIARKGNRQSGAALLEEEGALKFFSSFGFVRLVHSTLFLSIVPNLLFLLHVRSSSRTQLPGERRSALASAHRRSLRVCSLALARSAALERAKLRAGREKRTPEQNQPKRKKTNRCRRRKEAEAEAAEEEQATEATTSKPKRSSWRSCWRTASRR